MFGLIPTRFKVWLGLAGAAALAVVVALFKGRAEGRRLMEAEQTHARQKLREHYDDIDRQNIDPDRSYDRLRRLSDDKDRR